MTLQVMHVRGRNINALPPPVLAPRMHGKMGGSGLSPAPII